MDTADDFKEMTGAGLDTEDVVGIVEIDEEEAVVADDDVATPLDTSLSGEEEGEEDDDMMAYLFSDEELNAR